MATRHAPSVSQYSFSFAPASPLPDSPSTPVEVEADDLADDEDGLPPHSRWGSDGTFGGRPASALRDGGHMTERRGLWRDFDEHDETDGQTGQGREQDERALTSTGSPRSTPTQHHNGSRATDDPTHEHQAHSDPDGIPPASLADGRRRPSTSTAGSSASRRYPPRPPPPTDPIPPLAPDQRTVVSDRTYSSSIASSASGWIVPAPEPERSDERSTLHLSDDGSDDDQLEEQEEAETREGRLRLALEEAEDERQEREWLAWRAGGERQGPQGWNKDKGSKLDRVSRLSGSANIILQRSLPLSSWCLGRSSARLHLSQCRRTRTSSLDTTPRQTRAHPLRPRPSNLRALGLDSQAGATSFEARSTLASRTWPSVGRTMRPTSNPFTLPPRSSSPIIAPRLPSGGPPSSPPKTALGATFGTITSSRTDPDLPGPQTLSPLYRTTTIRLGRCRCRL